MVIHRLQLVKCNDASRVSDQSRMDLLGLGISSKTSRQLPICLQMLFVSFCLYMVRNAVLLKAQENEAVTPGTGEKKGDANTTLSGR